MKTVKILADENIPLVREAFGRLGDVATCSGREMTPERLRDVELLLVRSITKVDSDLLEQSSVRFVATATAGMDHLQLADLERLGIAYAGAPGSNAESVAQYVTAAVLRVAGRRGLNLRGRTAGVAGAGQVGNRVVRNLEALGMQVLVSDPPLERAGVCREFVALEDVLRADIVTLHVPLTRGGVDRTQHLIDASSVKRMERDAILINTSRGGVVDNAALLQALRDGTIAGAVLDVWEGEPEISAKLLERVDIGTPHIAGYSYDGKIRGTTMIYEAACRFLEVEPTWSADEFAERPQQPTLDVERRGRETTDVVSDVIGSLYDIAYDDALLREVLHLPEAVRGPAFDSLRKNYRRRREFNQTEVRLSAGEAELGLLFEQLQFRVGTEARSCSGV